MKKFLGFVRPERICLESSEQLVEQVLRERKIIKAEMEREKQFQTDFPHLYAAQKKDPKRRNEDFVLQFLANLNYETWASYEHKEENDPTVTINPLHDHAILIKGQTLYQQAYGKENMDEQGRFTPQIMNTLSTVPQQKQDPDKGYFAVDTAFATHPEWRENLLPLIKEVDDHLEPKLRQVIEQTSGTTVFVCGSIHFFSDYENNLYERLRDLSPVRLRLPDIDKF